MNSDECSNRCPYVELVIDMNYLLECYHGNVRETMTEGRKIFLEDMKKLLGYEPNNLNNFKNIRSANTILKNINNLRNKYPIKLKKFVYVIYWDTVISKEGWTECQKKINNRI